MFAVELRLDSMGRGARSARTDAVMSLTGALVRNGNLMSDCVVAVNPKGWMVSGVAPARDAFRKANWNVFVRLRIAALGDVNLSRPHVRFLGEVPETAPACQCTAQNGLFLFTTFLHTEPPLRCVRCYGTVPIYRLPRIKSEEHSELLSWECNYKACDTLQMHCTVGERFGERQMADLDSSLTRSGLTVCREIERLTGQPAYYYLHRGYTRSPSLEMKRKCPGCAGLWRLRKPLHGKFDFKCDKCRLLSNVAYWVR